MEWGGTMEYTLSHEWLKMRDYVQENKRKFLKEIHELQAQNYALQFLDESYIYENTIADFSLTIQDVHIQRKSGKGKRAVLFGALGVDGWLGRTINFKYELGKVKSDNTYKAGSIVYWVANLKGDYHKNFNKDIFLDLFRHHILNKLKKPTVIIMDRAPYHMIYAADRFCPSTARKAELID